MGINVLTVNSAFAANACARSASRKPPATQNTTQFGQTTSSNIPQKASPSQASTVDVTSANSPETTKTDNKHTIAQNKPVKKPPENFIDDFRKKIAVEKPKETQLQVKLQEQGSDSGVAAQPNIVQSWLAQYSVTVENGKEGLISKMEPKAGYKLAQLLAGLKSDKFPPGLEPIVKPAGSEAPQIVTDVQPGSKIVSPDALLANTGNPVANSSSQIPMTAIAAAKVTSGQESGQEPASAGDGKTITADQEPAVMGISSVSGSQKTAPLTGKELVSEVLTSANKTITAGQQPVLVDTATVSNSQKASPSTAKELVSEAFAGGSKTTMDGEELPETGQPTTTGGLVAGQDKFTNIQQEVLVGPKKSAFVVQKSARGNADNGQQVQVPISQNAAKLGFNETLSEFSPGNGKYQAGDPAGESILHKLSPAHIQISTNQPKERGNSTSKNASNSDSQQVFSNTDAPTHIIDQPSGSPQAAKSADNALSDNLSTDIGEQIQESISSSLRRGDQQITIRLHPPELGKVSIKFQEQAGEITGLLEVSKLQTRIEIQQALPQILRDLADSGVQIKRLNVMLADQSEQHAYKDQSLQDGWSGQHNSTEGGNLENKTANEYTENNYSYQDITEPHQMFITENSIDMLV